MVALGDIGDARSVESLLVTLKDESARVRYMAVEALDKIGDARAVDPLIEALKDKGWLELASGDGKTGKAKASTKVWVRQRAVEALARLGDPRAVGPIAEMLSDKHESYPRGRSGSPGEAERAESLSIGCSARRPTLTAPGSRPPAAYAPSASERSPLSLVALGLG